MDHSKSSEPPATDQASRPGLVERVPISDSGSTMGRQEAMTRFASLDSSMEKLFGLFADFPQEKQEAASQSSASTLPGSSPLTAAVGESSSGGTGIDKTSSSVGQAGQVHPATAPSFVKLASQSLAASLPAQSVSSPAPEGIRSSISDQGVSAGQGATEATPVVTPVLALSVSSALPPVPGYLVDKIKKGQYVDFNFLRPCNLKKLPVAEPSQFQLNKIFKTELQPIRNFSDWAEAWAVHGAVIAKECPAKAADQFSYFLLLSSAHRDVSGLGWLDSDVAFRKHAAEKGSIVWGEVMPTLWMTTVVSKGSQPTRESQSPRQKSVCFKWNSSSCTFSHCRFAHVCSNCRGSHQKIACPSLASSSTQSTGQRSDREQSPVPRKISRK